MIWVTLHPCDLGFLPGLISDKDPRPVREQLETNYAHGGGWQPFPGWSLDKRTMALKYPGDPVLKPLATSQCRDEKLFFYRYDILMILQPDGSFEVARVD